MNPFVSCLVGLMAWGFGMLAPPAATGDLGGSGITASGGNACYFAGETNTFCFLVTHDPSADEDIMSVDIRFPDGWTAAYTCRDNPDHPPGVFILKLGFAEVRA